MMTFTCTGETSGKASIGRLGRTTKPAPISRQDAQGDEQALRQRECDQTLEH